MHGLPLRLLLLAALVLGAAGCAQLGGVGHFQAGTAALDQGDVNRAVLELQAAATLLPEVSEVHNHLGLAYAAQGDLGLARGSFQRAVDLDCDNGPAQNNLALADAVARGEVPAQALLGSRPVPTATRPASGLALDDAEGIP
jgi:Flp pilus assembly protein TadD